VSYLLLGRNAVELDERLLALRQQLDASGFSTATLDVQNSSPEELKVAMQAAPFFGGNRVVILRNPLAPAKRGAGPDEDEPGEEAAGRVSWAELSNLCAAAPASTTLVVRHDAALSDGHFLVKFVRKLGWTVLRFDLAANAQLEPWVHARLEQTARPLGLSVSADAARALIRRLYPTIPSPTDFHDPAEYDRFLKWNAVDVDARLIVTEIDKLACAAEQVIDPDLIQALVADRGGYRAFALNEQLFSGQTARALLELHDVLDTGEPAQRVVALVASELSAAIAARQTAAFGSTAVATAAALTEGRLRQLAPKSSALNAGGFVAAAEALRRADVSEKTGRGSDMQQAIIPLVAEMAEALKPRQRRG